MYKFVIIESGANASYDIGKAEKAANEMSKMGYELKHVYQSTKAYCGGSGSVLVMVFYK